MKQQELRSPTGHVSRLARHILAYAADLQPGTTVRAVAFTDVATRGAVDQALSRLAKRGALQRVSRGAYVLGRLH